MSEETRFVIEPLDRTKHNRAAFDCGVPPLTMYLQRLARQDQERGAAAVYVLRGQDASPHTIIGYYTISATVVELSSLPPDLAAKLPRYGLLPAAIIGCLAVHSLYHGQGIGGFLLVHGLKRALRLSRTEIGITAVVVDAKDDRARTFYEHYGFLRDLSNEQRLLMPIHTVVEAFDVKGESKK